jgi:hypothetical protein
VAAANPELVEFNDKNREFWANQKILMDRRMADHAILETAIEMINSEAKRQVAIRSQKTFEAALQDAEQVKRRIIGQQARLGGAAPKANPLRMLIDDIVRKNPKITCKELHKELIRHERNEVIEEVDQTHIHFKSHVTSTVQINGKAFERKVTSSSAPISGLKHLLSRARKKIREENRSR